MLATRHSRFSGLPWVVSLLVLLAPLRLHASEGPPPVLNVKSYASPSGRYVLTVDPTRLHGGGPSICRVEKDGKPVWEMPLAYTFWEAAITDDGVAMGYAYTRGWRGFDGPRGVEPRNGEFVVAILNRNGSDRLVERRVRDQQSGMHSPNGPTGVGCFLDPGNGRFVVRFRAGDGFRDRGERWEVYSIADAKRLDDMKLAAPPQPDDSSLWYAAVDAQAIGDTGLALVTWYRSQWEPREGGVLLSVVDASAAPLWSLERPNEFSAIERFDLWDIPNLKLVVANGGLSPGFRFRSIADQERLSFEVTRDETQPGGWSVRETARVAEAVSGDRRVGSGEPLPETELEPVGVVTLQAGQDPDAEPLHVFEFDFDEQGRIGFVRRTGEGEAEFVLYAPSGERVKTVPLAGFDATGIPGRAVFVGNARWILYSCLPGDDATPSARTLDVETGEVAPIEGFESPRSFQFNIKGAPGQFAVLGDFRESTIAVFDRAGERLWSCSPPSYGAQDIAFNSRGELGALIGIRDLIMILDVTGATRTIDLNSTIGGRLNYVAGLEADADGGWILHDFNGEPPVYRLDGDGKVLAKFTPRFSDGRTFRLYGNVKRAPDGRLWTSDSASLLRLTDEGVVDLIIGPRPDADSLGDIRCATIDSKGSIYAVDAHTSFVHVFDGEGTPLRVLKPEPTDFSPGGGLGSITVAGDGAVYYTPDMVGLGARGYLRLNADGTRAGFQPGISGEVVDQWCFRPGSQERLVLGYERAFLTDGDGKKTKTIERRADELWLEHPEAAAFAPDGSFILLACPSSWASGTTASVTRFSAAGEALETFGLPATMRFPKGATNGRTIVVTYGADGVVIDVASGSMKHWALPPEIEKTWWHPFVSPDGAELWCIDYGKKSVLRFAMP